MVKKGQLTQQQQQKQYIESRTTSSPRACIHIFHKNFIHVHSVHREVPQFLNLLAFLFSSSIFYKKNLYTHNMPCE